MPLSLSPYILSVQEVSSLASIITHLDALMKIRIRARCDQGGEGALGGGSRDPRRALQGGKRKIRYNIHGSQKIFLPLRQLA